MRPTYLTINTSLVRENLRKIKDSLPEWSTSTAVIKANGYGHGSVMMGRIAVEEGYESLAVAIPEEAIPLRHAGIMVPIYLLGSQGRNPLKSSQIQIPSPPPYANPPI